MPYPGLKGTNRSTSERVKRSVSDHSDLLIKIGCINKYHTLDAHKNLKEGRLRSPAFFGAKDLVKPTQALLQDVCHTGHAMFQGVTGKLFHCCKDLG